MTEKTEIFKIITCDGKKKLYESRKAFDKNWKYHKEYRDQYVLMVKRHGGEFVKPWALQVKPMVAYVLREGEEQGVFRWEEFKREGK